MLERARARGIHDRLVEGDVRRSGLPGGAYDLVVCVLVDEHLPELSGLYAEARRLLGRAGWFVVVGIHPYFVMSAGMPTHFDLPGGRPVAIETFVHLPSEHVAAASAAGFALCEMHEALVDDEFVRRKPGWQAYRDWPFSSAWVWATA